MTAAYNPLSTQSHHGDVERRPHVHDCGDNDDDFPGVHDDSPAYFSFWVTVAFTLNYILGSGFLTLPWGFEKTGVLLGTIVLLVFAFFSVKSTYFILEAVERANILNKAHLAHVIDKPQLVEMTVVPSKRPLAVEGPDQNSVTEFPADGFNPGGYQSMDSLMTTVRRATIDPATNIAIHSGGEEYVDVATSRVVFARKLEITELCNLFLGDRGRTAYSATLIIYMFGTLWAYATVFANSFAAHLPIGEWSYHLYLLLFAAVVVPFSLREFSEQVSVQVVLSVFRIVMVSTMVITTMVAFFNGHVEFGERFDESFAPMTDAGNAWRFSPSGLHLLMPVAAYAYIFHHSIPSLAHNVRDKSSLTSLFRTALVISMLSYIGVGALVSMYFQDRTMSSSNLNWMKYLAFVGDNNGKQTGFAQVVSFFVVLFPAIDVASAYPLNAYTLGNNIMCAVYGKDTHKHDSSKHQLQMFRLIAAVPPLLGASIFSDLGKITDFTGLTAFGLAFIFPPLLAYFSQKMLSDLGIDPYTIHSSVWTSFPFQILLCVSGALLFLYVGGCLLILS